MKNIKQQFPGFPPEKQTWNFPTILNGYVHTLTGAEFKILWYIVRHTYGWQKNNDSISYAQFENGIIKKDGTIIDTGTGLTNPTINSALKQLEKRGFIKSEKKAGETTIYHLQFNLKENHCTTSKKIIEVTSKKIIETIDKSTIYNIQYSNFVAIRDYFVKKYKEIKDVEYAFGGGKDGNAISFFLKRKNKPEYKPLIDYYLKDEKSDRYPSISACLSTDTINKFNLKNRPSWAEKEWAKKQ